MIAEKADLCRLPGEALSTTDILGDWTNEIGSTMTIGSLSRGAINGSYESDDGQGGRVKGQLVGLVAGETIGWTVSWQPAVDSTTSWTGKFLYEKSRKRVVIYTLWYLSSGSATLPLWESFAAGQDTFFRPS